MDRRTFVLAATGAALYPYSLAQLTLSAFVEKQLAGTGFGGAILVARGSSVLLRSGYGLASREFDVAVRPETVFHVASITKLFTATLVMQLVSEKRLTLDDVIARHLPVYKGEGASTVTIRQLLNHTSGIENFDRGLTSYADAARTGMPTYQLPHTPRELMDQFASGKLVNRPGASFDYNNADYIILGQIIEAVEGASYVDVLARRILTPTQLAHTGMSSATRIHANMASTYYKDEDRALLRDMPVYPENWHAAGGMYSTVDDLRVFASALYGNRLVSKDVLTTMLTPGLDEYGLGQWVSSLKVGTTPHRFAQRPGRIMGANALLLRMLDDDIMVIILANTNLVDTDRLGFQIARHVLSTS
ncbi:MAG: beta-lactamase family protein [Gemmatimonadaceae bacterium]|nr:beta-lactamase family protein [Gemmatimonadaceae bacterium]